MSGKTQSIPLDIISEVIRCCSTIGHERTLHGIRMLSLNNEKSAAVSNMIIEVICREMPITRQALLSGSGRGNTEDARMYLYVLHNMFMGCDTPELSRMFSKGYRRVWDKLKNFKSLDPSHRSDVAVLQKFNAIKMIVETELSKI